MGTGIWSRNYTAEVGYVPRKNYIKLSPNITYLFYAKPKSFLLTHGPSFGVFTYLNPSFYQWPTALHLLIIPLISVIRLKQIFGSEMIARLWQHLIRPMPIKPFLPVGSTHQWNSTGGDYTSQPQKLFYVFRLLSIRWLLSEWYTVFTTELGYRWQPYVKFSINSSYNKIVMPAPWNKTTFWLMGRGSISPLQRICILHLLCNTMNK